MENISIAMCTYNGEKYLKEQLSSILNQTYKNIEVIVVDDGSTDGTVNIIKEFQKNHDCIKLYENEQNLGFIKNFEKAISLSSGDYVALSDQDDIWVENKLEILLNNMYNSQDSLLIYSNASLVNDNLEFQGRTLLDDLYPFSGNNNLYFIFNNSISGNTMMFKKELKDKILPFPDSIDFHDVWIGFVASSYSNIVYLEDILVKYRQHDANVTNINKKKLKKTYSEKINNKIKSFKKTIHKLNNYLCFLENSFPEHLHLELIRKLLIEYKTYDKYFFNMRLFLLLYNNKGKLFFQKKEVSLMKVAKMSVGIRVYKLIPFI